MGYIGAIMESNKEQKENEMKTWIIGEPKGPRTQNIEL